MLPDRYACLEPRHTMTPSHTTTRPAFRGRAESRPVRFFADCNTSSIQHMCRSSTCLCVVFWVSMSSVHGISHSPTYDSLGGSMDYPGRFEGLWIVSGTSQDRCRAQYHSIKSQDESNHPATLNPHTSPENGVATRSWRPGVYKR